MKPIAAGCLLLLCSVAVQAQTVGLDDRLPLMPSIPVADAEYQLGPGDLIEIRVFGVDDFVQNLRISASGLIKLPLLDVVKAGGLTVAELEEQLTAALGKELIRNPQVSVFVKEYRSQPVFILGAVRSPGLYQVTVQLRLVDVLSMAGGLGPNAGDEAAIQRRVPDTGETEMIKVNLTALLEQGDLSLNRVVQGGDVIHVQERTPRTVYVIGEVNRAGAFQLPVKQDLRVTQAFAWAGGPARTAKMNKGILVRYDEKGERREIPVNFDDIMKGKKEDFLVRADDIIFVPGSRFKNIGYSLLGALPTSLAQIPYFIP